MKSIIKKILFSLSLFLIIHSSIFTEMPSVADIFGNDSEDEIIRKVKEAQKLFESLSPEEMAEFEKIIEQTMQTMSPQDFEDIQGIAKMVEPHLEFPKEDKTAKSTPPPSTEKPDESSTKKGKNESSDTENVQQLIDNIIQQIDDILQKTQSDKSLYEEVVAKWASKITFDSMKRQILALKQDRLAKKLTTKDTTEAKDLYEQLELFYKEIKKLNNVFEVEDTFGLSKSKKETDKLIKQTKEILALFDETIDSLMPILEKFLHKYDPEALQMAKEADERAKQAQAHAQDATITRGSAPAISTGNYYAAYPSQQVYEQAGSDLGSGYYPGAYDQYGNYVGSNYPGYYQDSANSYNPSTKTNKDETTTPKKENKPIKSDENKKDKNTFEDSEKAYDSILENFDSYFDEYNDKNATDNDNFIQKKLIHPDADQEVKSLSSQITSQQNQSNTGQVTQSLPPQAQKNTPNASQTTQPVPTPITLKGSQQTQLNWIYSQGPFIKKGFKVIAQQFDKDFEHINKEIKVANQTLDHISDQISHLDNDKLKKLQNHTLLQKMNNRFKKYEDSLIQTQQHNDQQFKNNTKIIDDQQAQSAYQAAYDDFNQHMQNYLAFNSIENKIDKLQNKVQRTIKRKSDKKKSKARQTLELI